MRLFWKIQIISILLLCLFNFVVFSQSLNIRGQLSGWSIISHQDNSQTQFGVRYIPGIFADKSIAKNYTFDVECSINSYATSQFKSVNNYQKSDTLKPYRMWMRFSSSQFEVRLGLQKINFGSAQLIRPLMWFDRIDPRDPLQITDGVYGLLFRYYFLNNANIWLWGLYGNSDTKGWEFYQTVEDIPEYGGRFQFPVWNGEVAFSFHRRKVDLGTFIVAPLLPADKHIPENRLGFDGKWDIGVGLWLEGTIVQQKSELLPFEWRKTVNFGLDYTFDFGNGLNLLTEYFVLDNAREMLKWEENIKFSMLSINYPLGILDRLSGIFIYDWENKELYRFISWQRLYDNWGFYIFGFWNPENFKIYRNIDEENQLAGKGLQLMVVFNH